MNDTKLMTEHCILNVSFEEIKCPLSEMECHTLIVSHNL